MAIKISYYDHYPRGKQEQAVALTQLNGGLNIRDLPQHLKPTESPFMKNMWWDNGILTSRPGQNMSIGGIANYRWKYYGIAYVTHEELSSAVDHPIQVNITEHEGYTQYAYTVYYYTSLPFNSAASASSRTFYELRYDDLSVNTAPQRIAEFLRGKYFAINFSNAFNAYYYESYNNLDSPEVYYGLSNLSAEADQGWDIESIRLYNEKKYVPVKGAYLGTRSVRYIGAYPKNNVVFGTWYVREPIDAYTCTTDYFHNQWVAHIGSNLYSFTPSGGAVRLLVEDVPANRGTFFRYQDYLFYKNNGGYYRISYDAERDILVGADMTTLAYEPLVYVNADAETGSGAFYQPANLLTQFRRVMYKVQETTRTVTRTGNGVTTRFYATGDRYYPYTADEFSVGFDDLRSLSVSVNGTEVPQNQYTIGRNFSTHTIFLDFNTAPALGANIEWKLAAAPGEYKLPGWDPDSFPDYITTVKEVKVGGLYYEAYDATRTPQTFTGDGSSTAFPLSRVHKFNSSETYNQYPACVEHVSVGGSMVLDSEYTYDPVTGNVRFNTAPASGAAIRIVPCYYEAPYTILNSYGALIGPRQLRIHPAPFRVDSSTSVEVRYSLKTAYDGNQLMSCPYAITGGGQDALSILLGGSTVQPNAVYWNSNDNISMNPGYFPDNYYQLVGDSNESVTGFGRQYSDVIVLKETSLYKMEYSTVDLDGRNTISFTFRGVNAKIGCDLPWSIQLIQNNLVFCNRNTGVHILLSSSAAYENNVECISRKVDGDPTAGYTYGLLYDVRTDAAGVTSFDDDRRYWLCANGNVYLWEYDISAYKDPSWFFFTNVHGVSYMMDEARKVYCLSRPRSLIRFDPRAAYDSVYDEERGRLDRVAIDKAYRTPVMYFGGYEYLKDVRSLLFSLRSDHPGSVAVEYRTDYETRLDQVDLGLTGPLPEDTSQPYTPSDGWRYAEVFRRKPGCRHIRNFQLTLYNNQTGQDMAIDSIQVNYTYQDKQR